MGSESLQRANLDLKNKMMLLAAANDKLIEEAKNKGKVGKKSGTTHSHPAYVNRQLPARAPDP